MNLYDYLNAGEVASYIESLPSNALQYLGTQLGSPPRMRVIQVHAWSGTAAVRITPAHAGNTVVRVFDPSIKRDHPRACG